VSSSVLARIRALIQQDPGNRGLGTVPGDNLLTARSKDFSLACRSLATTKHPVVAIVTGFYIPTATPPTAETDGPLGSLFLASALVPLGCRVALVTDPFCMDALRAGLAACRLTDEVPLIELRPARPFESEEEYWKDFASRVAGITHLIALERVGPTHTLLSFIDHAHNTREDLELFRTEVPPATQGRCHTMRGRDITEQMRPAHLLFEGVSGTKRIRTIGIGDGGNEIGMGCIPWRVIRRNIPGGGLIACRTRVDHLIVCGVSNWGGYGLAAGVLHLRGVKPLPRLFDVKRERELLSIMVEAGPLVDGVLGRPEVSVDGLPFDRYLDVLRQVGAITRTPD
jgi:hypothetical protein